MQKIVNISLVISVPHHTVRRERHQSREHREAIGKGQCRHHDSKRFSITQPQWWMKQPATFASVVLAALIEGQDKRMRNAMKTVANG